MKKCILGGGWLSCESNLRASNRYRGNPSVRNADLGFRLVRK